MIENKNNLQNNIIEIGLNPEIKWQGEGELIAVFGPTLSGKTEWLTGALKRSRFPHGRDYLLFSVNNKSIYGKTTVKPFDGNEKQELEAIAVYDPEQIVNTINKMAIRKRVIGIDGAHLFQGQNPNKLGIVDLCHGLLQRGFKVIITGTDLNWQGFPQRSVLDIAALSTETHKLTAICDCGATAIRSQLVRKNNKDFYEPRCANHWNPNFPEIQLVKK